MSEEVTVERELYEPTRRFLHAAFLRTAYPHGGVSLFEADTSRAVGGGVGQWTRPDVAALVLGRATYLPHWRADLHTFEVKTARELSDAAVFEANAHGRFGNYSWLAFQSVGRAAEGSTGPFDRALKLAAHLGVGVIHFQCPEVPQEWVIASTPQRTDTSPQIIDEFISQRFPEATRSQITTFLARQGWNE